jgi:hypothetical protein
MNPIINVVFAAELPPLPLRVFRKPKHDPAPSRMADDKVITIGRQDDLGFGGP